MPRHGLVEVAAREWTVVAELGVVVLEPKTQSSARVRWARARSAAWMSAMVRRSQLTWSNSSAPADADDSERR